MHFGKHLFSLWLLLGFVSHAAAQNVQCKDPGSTMLWQVQAPTKGAHEVTVALMGSIHVGKPDFYPLPAVVDREFQAANTLVFEVDPNSAQSPQMALSMQQRAMLPGTQTLDQVVDNATMKSLQSTMQKLGVPVAMVSKMKPWMVSMMLTMLQVQVLGYDPQNGVENYLLQHKPAATRIAELESLESQLTMMESVDQAFLLRYTLQDFDSSNAEMETMTAAWRCGDHQRLASVLFDARDKLKSSAADTAALDKFMQQLLNNRNVGMANKIDSYFKTGQGHYFVVVGSLHLLGEGSVISLLQQKGYKVTPVRSR